MKWWHWKLKQGCPAEPEEVRLVSVQVLCDEGYSQTKMVFMQCFKHIDASLNKWCVAAAQLCCDPFGQVL